MAGFNRLVIADLSGELDFPLIRYGARISAVAEAAHSLVLPPGVAKRLAASTAADVLALCAAEGVGEPCYRMLLEPDTGSLFSLIWHTAADVLLLRYNQGSRTSRALARSVVQHAPCSVWLLPSGHDGRLSRIVAGFAMNTRGAEVVEAAATLARGTGAGDMIAAHVWRDPTHLDPGDEVHQALRLEQCRAARRFLWNLDLTGVRCTVRTDHSVSQSDSLLRVARENEADLLVIPAPEVSSLGYLLHRDETDAYLRAGFALLIHKTPNEYRPTLADLWRDLFYLPEPAFS